MIQGKMAIIITKDSVDANKIKDSYDNGSDHKSAAIGFAISTQEEDDFYEEEDDD